MVVCSQIPGVMLLFRSDRGARASSHGSPLVSLWARPIYDEAVRAANGSSMPLNTRRQCRAHRTACPATRK